MRAVVITLALAAYSGVMAAEPSRPDPTAELRRQITDLQSQVQSLRGQVLNQTFRLNDLEGTGVQLTAGSPGFSVQHSPYGSLLLDYSNATPYLDGFELEVGIINTTAVDLASLKISLDYGTPLEVDEKGNSSPSQYAAYSKARKHKDIDLTTTLATGKKTYLKLVVAPAKPDEVRIIDISVSAARVQVPVVRPQ